MRPILFALMTVAVLQAAPPPSLVETAPVSEGTLSSSQPFVGTLHYERASNLASQTEGVVIKTAFETTDRVRKGQVLAEIDHAILDARIEALAAALEELRIQFEKAQKELTRYTVLRDNQSIPEQKYDEFYYRKVQLEQALLAQEAQIKSLRIERERCILRAPFDGVITAKSVEVGQWLGKGGAVATLVDTASVIALFDVPARFAATIKSGAPLEVQVGPRSFRANVEGVIVQGNAATRTFPLKLRLKPEGALLLAGMEGTIVLRAGMEESGLLVPRDAVIKRFGGDVVFVEANQTAQMFPVQVLGYEGGMAAVRGKGLEAGMNVIVKGNERVFPQQPVRVK